MRYRAEEVTLAKMKIMGVVMPLLQQGIHEYVLDQALSEVIDELYQGRGTE